MGEAAAVEAGSSGESAAGLLRLYAVRAAFAAGWAAAALLLPPGQALAAAILLLAYPLWDAGANLLDARTASGPAAALAGFNAALSLGAALAVAASLAWGRPSLLLVFGLWAIMAGLLQLAVGWRRRGRVAGQWPMILSGAQSALVGAAFLYRSTTTPGQLRDLALYAAFGAGWFLFGALSIVVARRRGR